jgi:hypothetical protein
MLLRAMATVYAPCKVLDMVFTVMSEDYEVRRPS